MTNKHKLGAYIAPTHGGTDDWKRYLFEIDPGMVRVLMPGDSPTGTIAEVFRLCPTADVSLRWWDLDDGGTAEKRKKLENPTEEAPKYIEEMIHRTHAMEEDAAKQGLPFPSAMNIWFNGPNEPPTWEHDMRDNIALFNRICMDELHKRSDYSFMAGEIAVGHPEEWPPVWDWARLMLDDIRRYGDVLGLHEYWQPEGPKYVWTDEKGQEREDWGALAGRYQHLSYPVDVVISETGVDGRIYDRHATPDTGFAKFMSADKYAAQTKEYLEEVAKNPHILQVLPFITDFADKEWASFNTLHAREAFIKMLKEMDDARTDNTPPVATHLPNVRNGINVSKLVAQAEKVMHENDELLRMLKELE